VPSTKSTVTPVKKPRNDPKKVAANMRAKRKAIPIASVKCLVPDEVLYAPETDPELLQVQDAIDKTALLGKSLRETCRLVGIRYERAYVVINANPALVKRWNQARVDYLRLKVEEMEEIARDPNLDVQRARLLCDNIKWEAQRVARHIYGDHIVVSGDGDAPLIVQMVAGASDLVKKIRGSTDQEQ
jgi:hypothetical protein